MEKRTVLLTASANVGVGLWTSICLAFAKVFGVESKNFSKKLNIVMDLLKEKLELQMCELPGFEFTDFRVVKDGTLAYTATVLGVGPAEVVPPKFKEKIEAKVKQEQEDKILRDPECEKLADEGRRYFNEEKNYQKAYECFEKAASGSTRASYNLGYLCYYLGNGVEQDQELGITLMKEAAKLGYQPAIERLKELKIKI